MDVSENFDRWLQLLDKHWLLLEDLADFLDEFEHLLFLNVEGAHERDRNLAITWSQKVCNEH